MKNLFSEKRSVLLSYRTLRSRKGGHREMGARLLSLFDEGSFETFFEDLVTTDPLHFPGYREKLKENQMRTGSADAVTAGRGRIGGIPVFGAELGREFLMGSMGSAEGEKLARSFEEAGRLHLPLVIISASGGARMQEGMFSLFQMAKTAECARRFSEHGGLFISVLTHPTTGGVSASYASLGDVILAEPGALIGFAGPRVIEQTIGEKLPSGFQRAEFQRDHGFVDRIIEREDLKKEVERLLRLHGYGKTGRGTEEPEKKVFGPAAVEDGADLPRPDSEGAETKKSQADEPENIRTERPEAPETGMPIAKNIAAAERVRIARDKNRPHAEDFIGALIDDFTELDGDRLGGEDRAILGGIGFLGGTPVTVIAQRKGRSLKENLACHFGMPEPWGYRKALRLMRQAEKFGRPVLTFIDTPGAFPGKEAEEGGQSMAIAENLAAMSTLKVPVLTIVTGEGNSGGALAIGMGNRIWMLENAVYSVLSPEGFASILWKDASRSGEACDVMKLTAADLFKQGLVDRVFPEPEGGISRDPAAIRALLKDALIKEVKALLSRTSDELVADRYEKYRHFEGASAPKERSEGEVG